MFTQWGSFLLSVGLAEEFSDGGVQKARTTGLGREFLAYIRERGYPPPDRLIRLVDRRHGPAAPKGASAR